MSKQDIIILGGGIVGKSAALAFGQKGIQVLHIAADFDEKSIAEHSDLTNSDSTNKAWTSRVYAISKSSEQLFSELQIWQAIPSSRKQRVEQMRIFGDSGKIEDGLHFSSFEANLPHLAYIVESEQISRALDLASSFSKFIERKTAYFENISFVDGQACVKTNNGSFYAPLVIAADGANSLVRQQLPIEIEQDIYEHTAVIGNFACEKNHLRTAYQWFLENGDVLALLPLPEKRVSMVWSTSAEHASELESIAQKDPAQLSKILCSQASSQVFEYLGQLSLLNTVQTYPLKRQRAKQFIGPSDQPQVILMGDAAHMMHPLAGQGLNLGLRDVRDLLKIISEKESFRTLQDRVLLRRYERLRASDVDAILWVTHQLHQLFLKNNPLFKFLRNTGMRLLNQQSSIKKQLIAKALE